MVEAIILRINDHRDLAQIRVGLQDVWVSTRSLTPHTRELQILAAREILKGGNSVYRTKQITGFNQDVVNEACSQLNEESPERLRKGES